MPLVTGRPRRAPWPGDIRVSGVPYRLGSKTQDGPLIAHSASANPEESYTWNDWSGGFGQKFQESPQDKRYYYGLHVNPSIGDAGLILGYKLNSATPGTRDSTNGISNFFEMTVGGTTNTLFAVNGRYCLYTTDLSTWSVSKDFGSGKAALDAVTFQQNTSGSSNLAYVAMGSSEFIWKYDATSSTTTWTQSADLYALAFAAVGRELYRATEELNLVSQVDTDSDPFVAANWTAPNSFRVGDKSQRIVRLFPNAAGTLVILKRSSIHVLQPDGEDIQLYTGLKFTPDAENGKYPWVWENSLFTTYNGSAYAIGPAMELDPVGPERLAGNDSIVRGYITAGVGTPYATYAGLYNPDTGNSHIMQLGAYPKGSAHRVDVWHGSISPTLTGVKVTAAFMTTVGAASGHRVAVFGLSDGTIRYFTLPCVPNPKACSSVEFPNGTTADAANLFLSYTDLGAPDQPKHLHALTVDGPRLTTTSSNPRATVALDGNSLAGGYSTNPSSDFDTQPGKAQDFATSTTRTFIGMELGLRQTAAATSNDTPQVTSMTLDYAVRPQLQRVYEFLILAEDGILFRDGRPLRSRGAREIQVDLRAARNVDGSVTVILPDESTVDLAIDGYEETVAWDARSRRWRAAIKLRGTMSAIGGYNL